ncbi:hypothetical protein JCM21900_004161 [Sporobolomyces salmonicolor]
MATFKSPTADYPSTASTSTASSAMSSAAAKTPRSLPTPDLSRDPLLVATGSTGSSMFSVSAEYDADASDSEGGPSRLMTSKATLAPGPSATSRTHPPAPLLWSESGWHAGHFTFSPFGAEHDGKGKAVEERRASWESHSSGGSGSLGVAVTSSTGAKRISEEVKSDSNHADESKAGRSKLAPTAQPFVFSPKAAVTSPPLTASVAPYTRLTPLNTSLPLPPQYVSAPATHYSVQPRRASLADSHSSSPLEPYAPPYSLRDSSFDAEGHLVAHGSKYAIADEILQLQSVPLAQMDPEHLEELSAFQGAAGGRSRTRSESEHLQHGIETWQIEQQQQAPMTFPLRQGPFAAPPASASISPERSRSSSVASTASSYFAPRPQLERAATSAQLQSYFGPSPVEVNPPTLPGGFDSFDPTYPAPPHRLSRTSSFSIDSAQPYPPLAHPEPFNLTPEDPLYISARQVFVDSSCSSLNGPPNISHRQTMSAHFDRAMHTLNPLATLYGLSQEAANALLAEPAKSGVSEIVLKVAAMRGRQQQMQSVQRSAMGQLLPGPSPNNRKLALYKTELCRSWEEKGSCRYGIKCQFAHGVQELREVSRHPKFKSEICRTFWQHGSCPYGRRCCFIHQSLPSGSAISQSTASAPTSEPTSRAESPSEPVSRLAHRMTSTAITGAPQRNFGPLLSTYLGSSSAGSSSNGSALSSLANSPTQSLRPELAVLPNTSSSSDPFGSSVFGGLGLGIQLGRPGQAPPTYQDPPRSRLHRLAGLSSGASSTSLTGSSTTTSPVVSTATTFTTTVPHQRTNSNNSTFSSVSSAASAFSTPFLQRHGSSSSLSSGCGPSSPAALRPVGHDWLGQGQSPTKSSTLDWNMPETEDLLTIDESTHSVSAAGQLTNRFADLSVSGSHA